VTDPAALRPSLFALICLAAAAAGSGIVVPTGGVELPAFWPLSGVLVGALLARPGRRTAAHTAIATSATLLIGLLHGAPPAVAGALSVTCTLQAVAAAHILRRTCGPLSPTNLSHVWALVCVGALVPMAGGVLAWGVVRALDAAPPAFWSSWWLAHGTGIVLGAPLVLARLPSTRRLETACLLAGGSAVAVVVFSGALGHLFRVPAYLLPFFLWAVFRLGVGGTALTVMLLSVVGLWHSAQGRGPYALPEAPVLEWVLRSQGTMLIAAASLLLMAAAVAERRRVAAENERLVADLQKALAEIKTLRGLIPICAWCHKVRDDAGFWQGIEGYLDARTEATFSHSICPACTELAHIEIAEERAVR
jgi:integral membrane sensor domain MASE1